MKPLADRSIRPARPGDEPIVLGMIRALAGFEKLEHEVAATEVMLRQALFEEPARAECLLAFEGERPVGFAVFFHNFSTFAGRPGIYLEDLFVLPERRGAGIGKALFEAVARAACERGCARMEWAVLDWNQKAIDFYEKLGARAMDEWTVYRLSGEALERAGRGAPRGAAGGSRSAGSREP
jgi:GNAT superfamily N-acetyltransferase